MMMIIIIIILIIIIIIILILIIIIIRIITRRRRRRRKKRRLPSMLLCDGSLSNSIPGYDVKQYNVIIDATGGWSEDLETKRKEIVR